MRGGDEDGVHLGVLEQLLHRRIHGRHSADGCHPRSGGLIGVGAGGHRSLDLTGLLDLSGLAKRHLRLSA